MKINWKGFVFVDVDDDLLREPHDLGYGLTLRKATKDELSEPNTDHCFKRWSEIRGSSDEFMQRKNRSKKKLMGSSGFGKIMNLSTFWRHAVIECTDENLSPRLVNIAFSIISADLRMGIVFKGARVMRLAFFDFPMLGIRRVTGESIRDPNLPRLDDLPELRKDFCHFSSGINNERSGEVMNLLILFGSLDNLPDSSLFKVLGYFSVIEGLLSHSPKGGDAVDSIQRQLIRNINLLNNRLRRIDREIDFADFGEVGLDKVLKKLYGYRSAIAHGGNPKGSIKDISNMRVGNGNTDELWIHDWVRNMTKKLLFAAVMEPELVRDLK